MKNLFSLISILYLLSNNFTFAQTSPKIIVWNSAKTMDVNNIVPFGDGYIIYYKNDSVSFKAGKTETAFDKTITYKNTTETRSLKEALKKDMLEFDDDYYFSDIVADKWVLSKYNVKTDEAVFSTFSTCVEPSKKCIFTSGLKCEFIDKKNNRIICYRTFQKKKQEHERTYFIFNATTLELIKELNADRIIVNENRGNYYNLKYIQDVGHMSSPPDDVALKLDPNSFVEEKLPFALYDNYDVGCPNSYDNTVKLDKTTEIQYHRANNESFGHLYYFKDVDVKLCTFFDQQIDVSNNKVYAITYDIRYFVTEKNMVTNTNKEVYSGTGYIFKHFWDQKKSQLIVMVDTSKNELARYQKYLADKKIEKEKEAVAQKELSLKPKTEVAGKPTMKTINMDVVDKTMLAYMVKRDTVAYYFVNNYKPCLDEFPNNKHYCSLYGTVKSKPNIHDVLRDCNYLINLYKEYEEYIRSVNVSSSSYSNTLDGLYEDKEYLENAIELIKKNKGY